MLLLFVLLYVYVIFIISVCVSALDGVIVIGSVSVFDCMLRVVVLCVLVCLCCSVGVWYCHWCGVLVLCVVRICLLCLFMACLCLCSCVLCIMCMVFVLCC